MKTELKVGACERLASDPEPREGDIAFGTHISSTRRDTFVGDTSEPVISMHNYHHAVRERANTERHQHNEYRITTDGRFVTEDASMGTVMDDSFKPLLIPNAACSNHSITQTICMDLSGGHKFSVRTDAAVLRRLRRAAARRAAARAREPRARERVRQRRVVVRLRRRRDERGRVRRPYEQRSGCGVRCH